MGDPTLVRGSTPGGSLILWGRYLHFIKGVPSLPLRHPAQARAPPDHGRSLVSACRWPLTRDMLGEITPFVGGEIPF